MGRYLHHRHLNACQCGIIDIDVVHKGTLRGCCNGELRIGCDSLKIQGDGLKRTSHLGGVGHRLLSAARERYH